MVKPPARKGTADGAEVRSEPVRRDRSALDLLAQCRVDTFRSGGKGGQRQNKVETGVRLTHLPTGLVAQSREHRSQRRNRDAALARLRDELDARARRPKPRRPTRVPRGEKRKRRDDKARRSRVKRLRRRPKADDA